MMVSVGFGVKRGGVTLTLTGVLLDYLIDRICPPTPFHTIETDAD